MHFERFAEDIRRHRWLVHGVEVYERGRLIHSWGDTQENRRPIYSATKTITAIAAGIAVDEGKLELERSVLAYLPGDAVAEMDERQKEAYRLITLRRLLTMSVAGYPFRPSGESWLREALCQPIRHPEEAVFDYSNVSAYLVGVAVACAVGEDLGSFLNRRLFAPLGIENPPFARCPDGYFYGASSMALTVNELSRIGLMLASGGISEGRRFLSEAYVKAATAVQQQNREGGYGYFIWKYRDGFSINGKWGQKCYVLPHEGLMITFLSHVEQGAGAVKESMEKHILGL